GPVELERTIAPGTPAQALQCKSLRFLTLLPVSDQSGWPKRSAEGGPHLRKSPLFHAGQRPRASHSEAEKPFPTAPLRVIPPPRRARSSVNRRPHRATRKGEANSVPALAPARQPASPAAGGRQGCGIAEQGEGGPEQGRLVRFRQLIALRPGQR